MKKRVHKPSLRRALAAAVITALAVLPASALGGLWGAQSLFMRRGGIRG